MEHLPCPICASTAEVYLFAREGARICRCSACGLARADAATVRPANEVPTLTARDAESAATAAAALRRRAAAGARTLVVAQPAHPFQAAAREAGLAPSALVDVDGIDKLDKLPGGAIYEAAAFVFALERAADPVRALEAVRERLAPGGPLLVVTPSLDSWPARVMGPQWTRWQPSTRTYVDLQTIQSALLRAGFAEIEWTGDQRTRLRVKLPASSLFVTARRVEPPPRPRLSIVMPVYNERTTFQSTLDGVLAKPLPGIDKEIVVVESRSTDGTRELVQQYEGRPGVIVVYEDRPRGKGAAVRTGLRRATGTMVMIQDADSEYDVNDYDALLEPIVTWQRAFVLGSRHLGSWKVRRFADQPGVSAFFNFGHVLFRSALNLLYGQTIKDPFTMYKVFRRDCLHGLRFECNRFDFDFELVIKLLRKGYVPLELPVNYESRSFSEGKKVSAWRDPLTWIRALVKYRFASIYEDGR